MHPKNTNHPRVCERCHGTFYVPHASTKKKYCSNDCMVESLRDRFESKDKRTCLKCGKTFVLRRRDLAGKYCSRACSDSVNKNPPAKVITKMCRFCGTPFTQPDWKSRNVQCCSATCAKRLQAQTMVGKNHPLYKPKKAMKCRVCGIVCMVKPSLVDRFRVCSARCRGVWAQQFVDRVSSLERTMAAQFDDAGLTYTAQHYVGQFIVDFAFPSVMLAVECDGKYWHSLPGKPAKDRRKDGFLKKHGWTVLRLPEDDILESPEACLGRVLHAIDSQAQRLSDERKSKSPTSANAYVQRSLKV